MDISREQRVNIKFLANVGKNEEQIMRMLKDIYKDETLKDSV